MKASIIENKYRKVLVVTLRAKQIKKGAHPLVQVPGMRATRVALEEVDRGLIAFEFTTNEAEHKLQALEVM
ncbi:MAG: DNA-directed RNA polymerase subunit omega [Blastocatellia bacterium]